MAHKLEDLSEVATYLYEQHSLMENQLQQVIDARTQFQDNIKNLDNAEEQLTERMAYVSETFIGLTGDKPSEIIAEEEESEVQA